MTESSGGSLSTCIVELFRDRLNENILIGFNLFSLIAFIFLLHFCRDNLIKKKKNIYPWY